MTAETISVGTELLLGQIVDTDSAFLGRSSVPTEMISAVMKQAPASGEDAPV